MQSRAVTLIVMGAFAAAAHAADDTVKTQLEPLWQEVCEGVPRAQPPERVQPWSELWKS